MQWVKQRLHQWALRIGDRARTAMTTEYTPHQSAYSFAFAVFLAVIPTFGLAPVIAIGLAAWTDRLNQYAMLTAFAIFNPFVLSGIYSLSFVIGQSFSPLLPVYQYELPIAEPLYLFTRNMLLGTLVLNIVFTTAGYLVAHHVITQYQESQSSYVPQQDS
jgi:uncharacterized protein (DUF2062 family)